MKRVEIPTMMGPGSSNLMFYVPKGVEIDGTAIMSLLAKHAPDYTVELPENVADELLTLLPQGSLILHYTVYCKMGSKIVGNVAGLALFGDVNREEIAKKAEENFAYNSAMFRGGMIFQ